ncbi:MAG: hypothetical protein CMJ62_12915 [Planctomycetaceae bacterium]|nr:hypothetical protein [Planctomycetaceae bacterium]
MSESSFRDREVLRPWRQWLGIVVDLGIAASVLIAPLFMGGRGPLGRFVFIAIVSSTAIAWYLLQATSQTKSWRWSRVEWLLVAGLGVLMLQLVPLSQPLLELLSPSIGELLPIWVTSNDSSLTIGSWTQVSLHPVATRIGLGVYVAYALLFIVAYQRLDTLQDVHRLLKLIACATCFAAVVALLQFLLGNGKFLWVFEHPSRTTSDVVKGTFQNQNHLAQLLALGIGPILWWISTLSGDRRETRQSFSRTQPRSFWTSHGTLAQSLWVGFGIVVFAGLLTFSRGGFIAILAASSLALGIIVWKQMLGRRGMLAIGVVAGLMLLSLGIFGYEPLARKLGTLQQSQSLEELSRGRAALWSSHTKIIADYWLLGTGVGTHRDIYPAYLDEHFDVEFTHGESSYMQLLVETGLIGTGLVLLGIVMIFRAAVAAVWGSVPPALSAVSVAFIPGVVASVLHSFGDFVWYIPACMTTTILLIAVAFRVRDLIAEELDTEREQVPVRASSKTIAIPQLGFGAVGVVCATVAILATSLAYGPAKSALAWNAYRRVARQERGLTSDRMDLDRLAALERHLENTVSQDPTNARAHVHLAGVYLQRFDIEQLTAENPMPLSQIRDAALASQFPTRNAMNQWIDRAVGENRRWIDKALEHARRGVTLCPLQGEGYTFLASLAFLESPVGERKTAYIQQALATRPHDGRVLYVAGQEALLEGDIERALDLWKQAFHQETDVRDRLLRELAAIIPPKDLMDRFEPDVSGRRALYAHYSSLGDIESAQTIAKYSIPKLEALSRQQEHHELADTLRQLSVFYFAINATEEAISALQNAVAAEPSHFATRQLLGQHLLEASRATEALEHLEWCSSRRPDDQTLRDMLAQANRAKVLEQAKRPASNSARIR